MAVLSADLSTSHIGWAIFDEDNLLQYGRITPNEKADWRNRVQEEFEELKSLIEKYEPTEIYVEDVPLIKKQMITCVQLGAMQGVILALAQAYDIPIIFISVSTWRKDIGLFDGTKKGQQRDEMKVKSIKKANELFGIDLPLIFTKSGNFNPKLSNDDTSDAILLYCSTRDKYKVKPKSFGRR